LRKAETRAAGNAGSAVSDESSGVPRIGKNGTQGLKADPWWFFAARLNRLLKKAEDEANPTKRSPPAAKAALKLVELNVRAEARILHEMHFFSKL
jgi:hypothetical protein